MRHKLLDPFVGREALITSADVTGVPHLALGRLDQAGPEVLEVSGWFCPQTLSNLDRNPSVTVAVREGHEGYQIQGRVEKKGVEAIMDGYQRDEEPDIPRTRYRLSIRVLKTMELGDRPHSDRRVL